MHSSEPKYLIFSVLEINAPARRGDRSKGKVGAHGDCDGGDGNEGDGEVVVVVMVMMALMMLASLICSEFLYLGEKSVSRPTLNICGFLALARD